MHLYIIIWCVDSFWSTVRCKLQKIMNISLLRSWQKKFKIRTLSLFIDTQPYLRTTIIFPEWFGMIFSRFTALEGVSKNCLHIKIFQGGQPTNLHGAEMFKPPVSLMSCFLCLTTIFSLLISKINSVHFFSSASWTILILMLYLLLSTVGGLGLKQCWMKTYFVKMNDKDFRSNSHNKPSYTLLKAVFQYIMKTESSQKYFLYHWSGAESHKMFCIYSSWHLLFNPIWKTTSSSLNLKGGIHRLETLLKS